MEQNHIVPSTGKGDIFIIVLETKMCLNQFMGQLIHHVIDLTL